MQTAKTGFRSNAHTLLSVIVLGFFLLLILISLFFFADNNIRLGLLTIVSPMLFVVVIAILVKPRIGILAVLAANYFSIGLSRYVSLPTGLMVDGFLVITLASLFFSQLNSRVSWKDAAHDLTYLVSFWMFMTALQLINPETVSRTAWIYAMRSMAFYSAIIVPIVYIIYNKPKEMMFYINLTGWFTLFAIAKGLQQKFIGPDPWEQRWLEIPGNQSTHVLFGVIRIFSFFSDAGTYGGMMAYFGVVYLILAIHLKVSAKQKLFFWILALGSFYAMAISGTRSALAVAFVGFFVYAFLTKNFRAMFFTGIFLLGAIFILKYTTIGEAYYEIRRMRTIFVTDEPSLKVREENRALFSKYLESRPFGGGVGSAGNWGLRFTPGTFLAQTPTDGWFIQIWVEQGIVGLIFYILMLAYIAIKAGFIILFRLTDNNLRFVGVAFLSGAFGMFISSYTASTLGQMPGTIMFFMNMCYIFLMPEWQKNKLTI
ncbi:MAG: O-antigen ligase family protein [Paludibacter sp.]|jgi:hypothetical protein|nr:O-antigen ligase family protein [Paludibacter sp.]